MEQAASNRVHDLEEFIIHYRKALLHYIYSIVKNWEQAEDLYQDTMLSAFMAYRYFENKGSLKNWIYKIALNKCRDEWKKEKVKQQYQYKIESEWMNKAGFSQETEGIVIQKQSRQEWIVKINELPAKYRDSVILYYFHDCTIGDISKRTKLPLSTIKTHLRRGKQRLRSNVSHMLIP
jgi:RNA polymerase sigma factor (sigma-70 family)